LATFADFHPLFFLVALPLFGCSPFFCDTCELFGDRGNFLFRYAFFSILFSALHFGGQISHPFFLGYSIFPLYEEGAFNRDVMDVPNPPGVFQISSLCEGRNQLVQ